MSTSDNNPDLPTDAESAPTSNSSKRAQAIARRSFLRKSAGIAAPVVMTLQSGPSMAIASITCQDKTPDIVPDSFSGFTGGGTDPSDTDAKILVLKDTDTLKTDPTVLTRLDTNDGLVRCPDTPTSNPGNRFTDNGGGNWTFNGPDNLTFVNDGSTPTDGTGAVAYFTLDVDNEDVFEGCFGAANEPQDIPNARPMTCSCWSSLHP